MKEDERVNLELEMTEVKESLKKALNGGVTLGLTIEPKTSSSSPQVCKNSSCLQRNDVILTVGLDHLQFLEMKAI